LTWLACCFTTTRVCDSRTIGNVLSLDIGFSPGLADPAAEAGEPGRCRAGFLNRMADPVVLASMSAGQRLPR
jgi:hypothetical protein